MGASALFLTGAALRYALDHIPAACWIERGGTIRYANPALAAMIGARDVDAIVGRPSAYLLERAVGAPEIEPETLLAGLAPAAGEEAALRGAGDRIPVQVTRKAVVFDGEVMLLSCVRDIGAERDLRTALRDLEQRHRRLVDSDLIGVIEFDAEQILSANDYFLRLVGRSREELKRGKLKWREMTPPDGRARDDEFVEMLNRTRACIPLDKEFYRSDGTRVPVLLRCVQVSGKPNWRATCIVLDLTGRKKTEELAADRLRFEGVGMLAGGVAHSLNNLLTTIIGNAGLLQEDAAVGSNPRSRELVKDIIAAGEEGAALAAQLLAYSGQGRFVISSSNIRELIQTQASRIQTNLPQNVSLQVDLADDLPRVIGDPRQFGFVVEALVTNSIEAIGKKPGGEILIEARTQEVPAGALVSRSGASLPGGPYCVIRVRDNGAGMDAYDRAHALDPFFTTKFQGRGLGLAAVAGIVSAAGGAICIESEVGKGSDIQVYLPPEKADSAIGLVP